MGSNPDEEWSQLPIRIAWLRMTITKEKEKEFQMNFRFTSNSIILFQFVAWIVFIFSGIAYNLRVVLY